VEAEQALVGKLGFEETFSMMRDDILPDREWRW
jgi:hypothetical protein